MKVYTHGIRISDIVSACKGEYLGDSDIEVKGFVTDSREVFEGCVFVAIKGERCDGADFIPFFLAGWASFPEESRKYCGVFFTFIPFLYPLDTHFDIMNVQNHFESL